MPQEGLSAWDREDQAGFLRNLVVREGRRTGQVQARLVTSEGDFRAPDFAQAVPADGVQWTRAPGVAETTQGGKTKVLRGEPYLEEELLDLRFRISPTPSSRRTQRWPRCSTGRRSTWPAYRARSECSTSSAA